MADLLSFIPVVGLATLVITIILYIVVMPRKKDGYLGTFGQALHNFFHFKKLYLESLFKFFYVLANVGLFCFGIYLIVVGFIAGAFEAVLYGLGCLLVAPILFRLAYECLMMGILLVKNVIDINNKMPSNPRYTTPAQPAAPTQPAAPAAPAQPAAPKAAPVAPAEPKVQPVAPAEPKVQPVAPKAEPVAAPAAPTAAPVQPAEPQVTPAAPKAPPAPFCTVCGSRNNADGTCPNHCTK